MHALSRRVFIQQAGVASAGALIGVTVGAAETSASVPDLSERWGRAFAVTPVRNAPDHHAPLVRTLHPDAVTPIQQAVAEGRWYQLPDGYVPRPSLQPITPVTATAAHHALNSGTYVEVAAPASAVRGWAGAHAPIRARLGHGAVVYVADSIVDDRGMRWLGVTESHDMPLVGWSPAAHYAPLHTAHKTTSNLRLNIEIASAQMSVIHRDRRLAHVPAVLSQDETPIPFGTPHRLTLMSAGLTILMHGVYWHNDFVREAQETRSMNEITGKVRLELPTYAARWLWTLCANDAEPLAVTIGQRAFYDG